MKAHVFTTSTAAACGSRAISWAARVSTPSMTSLSTWFFGHPSVVTWMRRRCSTGSVPEVDELHGDAEVALAQQLHHGLQVVALLARHPHLIALDGDLHLELGVLHLLDYLARLLDRDPLLEVDALLRRALPPPLPHPVLQPP